MTALRIFLRVSLTFLAVSHASAFARAVPVIEVGLSLANGKFSIETVQVKNGHPRRAKFEASEFVLNVKDANGKILAAKTVDAPSKLFSAPIQNSMELFSQHAQNHVQKRTDAYVSVNFPYSTSAKLVELRDKAGSLVDSYELQRAEDNRHLKSKFDKLGDDGYFDIALVGENYSRNPALFDADVNRFINVFFDFEPFRSRANRIRFHKVLSMESLQCFYDPSTPRLLVCNEAAATRAVIAAGAPYDHIAIIVNTPDYGGSGGNVAVTYNGTMGPTMLVHELGHSLGGLLDEYTLFGSGPLDGQVVKNCYAGVPTAPAWDGIVTRSNYTLGCNHPNWYRSSVVSVMLDLSVPFFNQVSINLMNEALDHYIR